MNILMGVMEERGDFRQKCHAHNQLARQSSVGGDAISSALQ